MLVEWRVLLTNDGGWRNLIHCIFDETILYDQTTESFFLYSYSLVDEMNESGHEAASHIFHFLSDIALYKYIKIGFLL
jgi:hypothetical protein